MSRTTAVTRDLPDFDDKPQVVEAMFDRIAPRYDALNRMLTFRMDVAWRRTAVDSLALPPGARVLDLACGTGDLCRTLAHAGHRPVGVDFSAGMLRVAAHRRAAGAGRRPPAAVRGRDLRRAHVRLRATQFRRARAGARGMRAALSARTDGSRCSMSPNPRARSSAPCTAHGSATSSPSSEVCCRIGPRTATSRPRPRTSRRCRNCWPSWSTPASSTSAGAHSGSAPRSSSPGPAR